MIRRGFGLVVTARLCFLLLSSMKQELQNINAILGDACKSGPISYCDFIEIALYHPEYGYYKAAKNRVGRSADRDFYTAESLGSVFSELVVAASVELLGFDAASASFVEIAAEPETSLLSQLSTQPFKDSAVLRLGDLIDIKGPVVIFANEWLDALPFHRLLFKDGKWQERGVSMIDGTLREVLLPEFTEPLAAESHRLPPSAPEGYQFDWPLAAEHALSALLKQDWHGILLLFDYGKPWEELLQNCPAGTARTYYKHKTGTDLLQNPGHTDITCDICWTPLQQTCEAAGLDTIRLESQEAFFVQRAAKAAEAIVCESAGQFSTRRQTLMELIHPAHMGRKFQVLSARRSG